MLDLLGLSILAWSTWIGYRYGGLRTLLYVSAAAGTAFVVQHMSPWLSIVGNEGAGGTGLTDWLERIMQRVIPLLWPHWGRSIAVFMNPKSSNTGAILRVAYRQIFIIGYGVAVFLGVMGALRTFETVWPEAVDKLSVRWTGTVAGMSLGTVGILLFFKIWSTIAWVSHVYWMQSMLYQSLLAHAWTSLLSHGIFGGTSS